jgi:hypothetical protein
MLTFPISGLFGNTQRNVFDKAAGAAAPTWTKKAGPAIQNIAFAVNFADFTSVGLNNSSTSDTIVVMVTTSDRRIGSATVNGDSMTLALGSSTGTKAAYIFTRTGNIYTTPTVTITSFDSSTLGYIGMTAGVLTGVNATPSSTGVLTYGYVATPATTAITVPSSGILLAVGGSETGTADAGWNITEDYDLASGSAWRHSSAYSLTTGSVTPTVSTGWDFVGSALAAAAWGP